MGTRLGQTRATEQFKMCGVVTVHVCNHTSIWLKAYLTLETLISLVPSTLPYAFDMSIMVKAAPNYDAQVESFRETSRNAKKCAILATTENQNEEPSVRRRVFSVIVISQPKTRIHHGRNDDVRSSVR